MMMMMLMMIYSHKALHYPQMNIGKLKIGNSVELVLRRNGLMFFCAETTSASLRPRIVSDNSSVSGREHKHSVPIFPMQSQIRAAA